MCFFCQIYENWMNRSQRQHDQVYLAETKVTEHGWAIWPKYIKLNQNISNWIQIYPNISNISCWDKISWEYDAWLSNLAQIYLRHNCKPTVWMYWISFQETLQRQFWFSFNTHYKQTNSITNITTGNFSFV